MLSRLLYFIIVNTVIVNAYEHYEIPTEKAQEAIDTALSFCKKKKVYVSAAILDNHGHIIITKKMTKAHPVSLELAIKKARLSAIYGFTSRKAAEINAKDPNKIFGGMNDINLWPGGVPFKLNNKHAGGIAVSGSSGDIDEICAQSGANKMN